MSDSGLLRGQWCLVTGGGRGIGAAIATAFAQQGAKLIITARSTSQLQDTAKALEAAGAPEVVILPADMSTVEGVEKLASEALNKAGGRIHVLVNNAGMIPEEQSPIKGNPDNWDKAMQLNVLAPMRLTRLIAPPMAEAASGTIINMCSVAGLMPSLGNGVYSTTKYALRGWGLNCYEELRSEGIKVVTIHPGFVVTDMVQRFIEQGADSTKMIRPEDIAEAAMLTIRCSNSAVPQEIVVTPMGQVFNK